MDQKDEEHGSRVEGISGKVGDYPFHFGRSGVVGDYGFTMQDAPPDLPPNPHMNRIGLEATNCFIAGTNCAIDSGDGVTLIGDELVSNGNDGEARFGDADNQIVVSADGSVSVIGDARKAVEAVKRTLPRMIG